MQHHVHWLYCACISADELHNIHSADKLPRLCLQHFNLDAGIQYVKLQVYDRTKLDSTSSPWTTVLHSTALKAFNPHWHTSCWTQLWGPAKEHQQSIEVGVGGHLWLPFYPLGINPDKNIATVQQWCFHLSNTVQETGQSQEDLAGVLMLCHCAGNDSIVLQGGD